MLPSALFHSIVTFILVNLSAAAFRSNPAAVLEPSAVYLLVRIQFRLWEIIKLVLHAPLASIVAFLFVYVLSSPRHVHHAAVSPKFALHQFVGAAAAIRDRHARETVADIVHPLEPILVDAILLVDAASPSHRSYIASSCSVWALYQIIVTVAKISRHVFFFQVRSKLAPEIIISISVLMNAILVRLTNGDHKVMAITNNFFILPRLVEHP